MSRRRSASRSASVRAAVAVLSALLLGAPGELQAQAPKDEAQVKAAFVYNFLKFVEWPASAFQGPADPLVVAVVGGGPAAEAAAQFLAGKQVGERRLVVRRIAWDGALSGAHAVFVGETDARRIRHVLDAAGAGPILFIGEGAEFAAGGGAIALVMDQRRVRFDVNIGVAAARGLTVSSKLLALTRVVISGGGSGR